MSNRAGSPCVVVPSEVHGQPSSHPVLTSSQPAPLPSPPPSGRPLGNATFLSLGISKTRLLRHMQGAQRGVL